MVKFYRWKKILNLLYQNLQFIYHLGLQARRPATGKASRPQKRTSSTWKKTISFFYIHFAHRDPADQNQCGSMRFRIHNTIYQVPVLIMYYCKSWVSVRNQLKLKYLQGSQKWQNWRATYSRANLCLYLNKDL